MIVREKIHFIFRTLVAMLLSERLKEQSKATSPHKYVTRLAQRRLRLGMVTGALPCAGWG
jgi:Na+(H+)/acetate symporter ActP